MTYKKKGADYMSIAAKGEDWHSQPSTPDVHMLGTVLTHVKCPLCGTNTRIGNKWLIVKSGFSNLQCIGCKRVISAKWWMCACDTMWYKCDKHFLGRQVTRSKNTKIHSKRKKCGVLTDHCQGYGSAIVKSLECITCLNVSCDRGLSSQQNFLIMLSGNKGVMSCMCVKGRLHIQRC